MCKMKHFKVLLRWIDLYPICRKVLLSHYRDYWRLYFTLYLIQGILILLHIILSTTTQFLAHLFCTQKDMFSTGSLCTIITKIKIQRFPLYVVQILMTKNDLYFFLFMALFKIMTTDSLNRRSFVLMDRTGDQITCGDCKLMLSW